MSKQAYTCVFQYNPGSVGLTQAHPNYCECILETTASLPPTSGKYLLHPATSFVLEQSESNPISLWMKVEHLSRYLFAGDGKTHYIIERLKCIPQYHQLIIAVNETFTYMTAIEKLCSLPSDKNGCAIFFNITILPPPVSLLL